MSNQKYSRLVVSSCLPASDITTPAMAGTWKQGNFVAGNQHHSEYGKKR